jgi:primary-amine oxidase
MKDTVVRSEQAVGHPLDPLRASELRTVVETLRVEKGVAKAQRFAHVSLREPAKDVVRTFTSGDLIEREALAIVYDPGADATYEAVVSLDERRVTSWEEISGVQPSVTQDEFAEAIAAVRLDSDFRRALERRGITDPTLVHIEPWSIGTFAPEGLEGRRLVWTPCWVKSHSADNHYAHPIRGLHAIVDLRTMEVVKVEDHGVTALPSEPGNYNAEAVGSLRADLRPLEILQPEGPSFEVDGWEVRWQKWRFRIGFDQREGLVLHTVAYEDDGRVRPILHRVSIAELVIPYADPGPGGYRKNAFDIGEYGVGHMTNSLELGCDCLGEIRYLDVDLVTSSGDVVTLTNAICLHEEDAGLLWKHYDWTTDTTEVRRSRRLVVSSIATIDNYEYGFYWYLYQDGTIEFEAKLTGIVLTAAVGPGETPRHGTLIAPQLSAMYHQHFFCARLDFDVDGLENTVREVNSEALPWGDENPHGGAFIQVERPLTSEQEAQRLADPGAGRFWKVENPTVKNSLGQPVAYKLIPGSAIVPFAQPEASISRRAAFMAKHLWVTPFDPSERYPAGDYPNQHPGGAGLPEWTAQNRPIERADIVVWHVFGSHHVPRPEDWPVMPVERVGFQLKPLGFFDRNPSLDVPPASSDGSHCAKSG